MGGIFSRTRSRRAELWNQAQVELEALAAFDAEIVAAVRCLECMAPAGVPCHVFMDPDRPKKDGPHLERQRSYDRFRGWVTHLRPRAPRPSSHQNEGSKL